MPGIRTALRLDALASAALGVLLALGAPLLDEPLGLPVTFSITVGVLLLTWAAAVAWASMRLSRGLIAEVIGLNAAYVVASIAFALGWSGLTGLGIAFVLVQAAAVTGLIAAQLVGLRRNDDLATAAA